MSHDANFKEYLAKLLKRGGIRTSVSLKVGKLPLEIDMVISMIDSKSSSYFQPLFTVAQNSKCSTFIIEYKSFNDRLTIHHLYKIIAYRALYLINNSALIASTVGHLIITTKFPRKVLSAVKHSKMGKGIFLLHFELPIYLIVINYLPITKENFGLLFFSTGRKQYEFIRHILEKDKNTYFEEMFLSFISIFYYEEYRMARSSYKPPNLKKNIREAVNFLGIKEVVDAVGVKEVVDAVGVKAVVDAVGVKAVVDALGVKAVVGVMNIEDILSSLSDKELVNLKKKIEKKLSES